MPTARRSPAPAAAAAEERVLRQSKALGDRTRYAILRYLVDAPQAVGVAELTGHFGLNHNAIRQHLAKLRDAGLATEELAAANGPGRPALRYRPTPGAEHRWDGPTPYEALARMLVEMLRGEGDAREVGRRQGARLARDHRRAGDAVAVMEAATRRLGFEPHREVTDVGVDIVLERCPFASPATDAPEIICEIHRGIAEGISASVRGSQVTVEGLVLQPPAKAGCRIQLAGGGVRAS
jgi:predicted ArsR family transcriptional regulator